MTDAVPNRAKLRLDNDVAAWLHEQADRHYDGDVQQAMNEALRALMTAERTPADPWALLVAKRVLLRETPPD